MKTYQEIIEFIKLAHKNQKDKLGIDYYKHCIGVFRNLSGLDDYETKCAALLHDILEDTKFTEKDLLDFTSSQIIVDIVKIVTKEKGKTYFDFINSIINSDNKRAIKVKIADLKHNLLEERLDKLDFQTAEYLKRKYTKALTKLQNVPQ